MRAPTLHGTRRQHSFALQPSGVCCFPITVEPRVTDIWRSYIVDRLVWDTGGVIAFTSPFVTQYRNPHSLAADFKSESDVYSKTGALLATLASWTSQQVSEALPAAFVDLFETLHRGGFVQEADVGMAHAWVADLNRSGYVWPKISTPHTAQLIPTEAPIIDERKNTTADAPSLGESASSSTATLTTAIAAATTITATAADATQPTGASTKVCLVQIPKTGSESLTALLGLEKDHRYARNRDLSRCFSAAVVRNPWDRMMSWYSFCRAGHLERSGKMSLPRPFQACTLARNSGFEQWLPQVLRDKSLGMLDNTPGVWAFESASAWILDSHGRDTVDYIASFDDILEFSRVLAAKVSRVTDMLPHKNNSTGRGDATMMSREAQALICAQFAYEIRRFNFMYKGRDVCDSRPHFCYMAQSPAGIEESLVQTLSGEGRTLLQATYASHQRGCIHVPNSTWAEGRNAMYSAMQQSEKSGHPRCHYFIFLDGDAQVKHSSSGSTPFPNAPWDEFERFLRIWEPAVGSVRHHGEEHNCPKCGSRGDVSARFRMDHIVIAIHHEAASNLLPYNVSVNGGNRHCFYGPPVFQTGIAGALYKGHILRLETLTARDRMNKNPSHECAGVSRVHLEVKSSLPVCYAECVRGRSKYDQPHGEPQPKHLLGYDFRASCPAAIPCLER